MYLGTFFAPAILFFAISGGVQTYRLTELPQAPAWSQWLSSLHKDQAAPRPRKPRPAATGRAPVRDHPADAARRDPAALKAFVALMSLGLAASTLLGIAVALALPNQRRTALLLLAAGTLLPLALILA
ncbi:MAG: hypothetical protein JO290_00015 [Sphingomonadaceae bacterium]|nr:hypothetical protein [Sphingomonadaceae bacterium]